MQDEIRLEHAALVSAIGQVLARDGVPAPIRAIEAEIMAEADLLGVPSHGVRMLPGLVKAIRAGHCKPSPQLNLTRERGAICVLECDNGPGRYTSAQAMSHAIERARASGVGVCLALHTTHWGRAHAYAYRAAQAGLIGLCTTNAIPNMLAWGSSQPLLGNNPLAIGVPHGPAPIVLDMAMSQAAVGKVGTYLREGKKAPPGWGLDSAGQPTDDPAAIMAARRFLPMGDHKGAGLALMIELLTGALAGGLFSQEIAQANAGGMDAGTTKLFAAIDVEAFIERERFDQRVDDMLEYLRTAEPGLAVLYPGERGWQTRERYLAEGIPIHAEIVAQLQAIDFPL